VGKSALFNRLVKKRLAIVRDTPWGHVTRDYQEGRAYLADLQFLAVDTSGLEPLYPKDSIQGRATVLTSSLLHRSDVVMLLLDGRDGVLPSDVELIQWIRGAGEAVIDKVILVANKCERSSHKGFRDVIRTESATLGLGDLVAISAETGEGMSDLFDALSVKIDPLIRSRREPLSSLGAVMDESMRGDSQWISHPKVAIMGLTNVVR